jgi:hypothetical protein
VHRVDRWSPSSAIASATSLVSPSDRAVDEGSLESLQPGSDSTSRAPTGVGILGVRSTARYSFLGWLDGFRRVRQD